MFPLKELFLPLDKVCEKCSRKGDILFTLCSRNGDDLLLQSYVLNQEYAEDG